MVTFSGDGTTLASAGRPGNTVKLWRLSSDQLLRGLKGHSKPVAAVALSDDGTILAFYGSRGFLEVVAVLKMVRLPGASARWLSVVRSGPDGH